jgi:biopolymer transport protein TolR
MAGGGSLTPSSGRRRSLDGEMNLVPFIDLLSMCICFLLMTAIWIEVGSISLRQLVGSEGFDKNHPVELQLKLNDEKSFQLSVEQGGRVMQNVTIAGDNFEQARSRLSQAVGQIQGAVMNQDPNLQISARVVPSAAVSYGSMISLLDILKGYGLSALAVVPVRGDP